MDFETDFHSIFHDATDILDFFQTGDQGQSIPCAYQVSASNRFPIFRPAAKIVEKGHFVDGGYFENSGLASMTDLYEHIKHEMGADMPECIVFLQIINGVNDYIRSQMDSPAIHKKIHESSK